MASSTTTGFPGSAFVPAASVARTSPNRPRRITPQAGHALEILGHAIEYLTDEYIRTGASLSSRDAELEAVQLLMALNRQVYFECPQVPSFGERCWTFLHLHVQ
jgi:hypothetical protein